MYHILVVDDDPSILIFIKEFLQKDNYRVSTYKCGEEALESFKHEKYNLVISDLDMPNMNGQEFFKGVKSITSGIPFIFLTANKKFNTVKEIMKMGADDYWVKPITPSTMGPKIEALIREKEESLAIKETQIDSLLEERENKRLVSWKNLYGMKEVEQSNKIMSFLSRNIEQAGSFMWLELLTTILENETEESQEVSLNRTMLNLIVESTEYIKKILDDLKYVTTLRDDSVMFEFLELPEFVNYIKEIFESDLLPAVIKHKKKLQLDIINVRDNASIEVDSDLIKKILLELLFNAIKYSPEDSKIMIYLDTAIIKEKEFLEISYWNEPIKNEKGVQGIPYEHSEAVFDLFYTIDDIPVRIKEEEWSQGSGLYIVRKLLQKMNSFISCKNVVMHTFNSKKVYVRTTINIPIQ